MKRALCGKPSRGVKEKSRLIWRQSKDFEYFKGLRAGGFCPPVYYKATRQVLCNDEVCEFTIGYFNIFLNSWRQRDDFIFLFESKLKFLYDVLELWSVPFQSSLVLYTNKGKVFKSNWWKWNFRKSNLSIEENFCIH